MMSVQQKRAIIKTAKGTVFTATFRKADGSVREMNCRRGVTKHLKGGTSTIAHKQNLLGVFDMQKQAYRCINLDTLIKVKINGAVIDFQGAQ